MASHAEGEQKYSKPQNGKETVVWAIWVDSKLTSPAQYLYVTMGTGWRRKQQ